MPNANAGVPIRFENGGVLKIFEGSTEYTVLSVRSGTGRFQEGLREGIEVSDRGTLPGVTGNVIEGDERPTELSIEVELTTTYADANEIRALLLPAATNGKKTLFKIEIDIPDARGASTGTRFTFNYCYLPDGPEIRFGGPGEPDVLAFTARDMEASPTVAAYS